MRHSSRLASSPIFAAPEREYMTHHPKVHSTPSPDMAGSFFSAEKPNCATSPYHCSTYYMAPPCFFFFFQEDLLSISESLRQKSPTHTHTHIPNKQTFTLHCFLPSFLLPRLIGEQPVKAIIPIIIGMCVLCLCDSPRNNDDCLATNCNNRYMGKI
jgi:hypothetical protein